VKAYPDAGQRRLLVLTPTYLLILDELKARSMARFDWFYHNRGTRAVSAAATQGAQPESGYAGMEYVQKIRKGNTNGTIRVLFEDGKTPVYLTMAGGVESEVLVGDGVGESVEDRVPLARVTRHGMTVPFAAVIEPVKAGAQPTVSDVTLAEENGFVIRVARGDKVDTIHITNEEQLQVLEDETVVLEGR